MKGILLSLLVVLSVSPAFASIGDCDLAIHAAGIPIDGLSGNGPTDPNLRVDCSQCTQAQAATALQMAQTASNWDPVAKPNVDAFKAKINADYYAGALPFGAYEVLAQWVAPLQDLVAYPTVLQKAWQDVKTNYATQLSGNYPNTTPYNGALIIDQIEQYATDYDVPLKQ